MRDISAMLKEVYNADAVAIVPGGGTFGMEAVARQFATDAEVLVVRNGWFSYRWSQIFESGDLTGNTTVIKAREQGNSTPAPFAPARSRRWSTRSAAKARRSCSRRMWKPVPV